jgi:8-oxo-dGTP pyrophosphatase MutT (NUDIX family)
MSAETSKTFVKKHESVACILFNNSKILLIKRRDIPVWVLPGGGIDQGESPETAAVVRWKKRQAIK